MFIFLESMDFPDQKYIGLTDNVQNRLAVHNAGQSLHTAKYKPWWLVTYIGFTAETKAIAFENI